tara:strand:+ start:350 stop:1186 length:837 start_codon:yes stop_codon:yes gene_type:complete
MKNLIFAGCSFTHAPDSWAHCSNPWRDERNKTQAEIEQKTKAYTRTEFGGTRQSQTHVEKMYADRLIDYPPNRIRNFKPEHIWDDVKKLPKDQFSINILGSGANSNTDIARSVIHFIENFSGEVDTCIFQITGFSRQTKFVEWVDVDPADPHYIHTHYDDICFNKLEKHQASPDDDWHCIEAIEALQNLTTFCKANNVNIKYFHGWDNRPGGASEFNYFTKKYMRYVEPNLLTSSNILDIASRTLKPNEVFQHNDGHPSTLSHKHFWNTIIYPYIVRN